MSARLPITLVCDAVSWRLDVFERALDRIYASAVTGRRHASLAVGYRSHDDLALLAVTPEDGAPAELGSQLVFEARLPGLRALDLPHDVGDQAALVQRALSHADVVVRVGSAAEVVAVLRGRLGMLSDARAAMRLQVAVPLRFETPGGWLEASSSDLTAGGVFVKTVEVPTLGDAVTIEFFPRSSRGPVRGRAVVVRHTPDGFGARLTLEPEAQSALYRRIQARRAPDPANPQHLHDPATSTLPPPAGSRHHISAAISETLANRHPRVLTCAPADGALPELTRTLEAAGFEALAEADLDAAFGRLLEELLALEGLVVDAAFPAEAVAHLLHRVRTLGGETQLPIIVTGAPADPGALLTAGADDVVPASEAGTAVARVLGKRREELLS